LWATRKVAGATEAKTRRAPSQGEAAGLASAPYGRATASASLDGTVKLVPTGVSYLP
jgi:hypothetical protein